MAEFTAAERERQRVVHLVLGRPRPKVTAKKGRKTKAREATLAPGVEEQVALREAWRGIEGTPQTREHAAREAKREGSIARLHASGAIDVHQLAAAEAIRRAHDEVVGDVRVRTAKLEPRSSKGRAGDETVAERLRALAYSRWRAAAGPMAAMLLAIIVDDMGLVAAARRWRMSNRRAKAVLVGGLDRWVRG